MIRRRIEPGTLNGRQIKIRDGTISDLEQITEIEQRVFKHPWSKEQIQYELIEQPTGETYVVEINGQVIGYLMSVLVGNEVQILNIAVDIPWQHRGYGKYLLNGFLEKIDNNTTVFLEVKRSNLNAIKLYIDTGFVEVGRRDNYYEDGEDAILMAKNHTGIRFTNVD